MSARSILVSAALIAAVGTPVGAATDSTTTTTTTSSTTSTTIAAGAIAPSAPTLTKVVSEHSGFIMFFTPTKHRGSSPITTYQYSLTGGVTWVNRPTGTTGTSISMMGLPQHTSYALSVRAISAAGAGAASNIIHASTTR